MEQEGHHLWLPKLSVDGSNWVVYWDRLIWALQANTFNEHVAAETPPTAYTALSNISGLTPAIQWAKEESTIKQVLCSTLPNSAFNWIKNVASVKSAWETLKWVYEERSKALVANIIQRFQNKHCKEDESVCIHFESLADLCEQLMAMGKSVTDEDYTDTLLALLPALYNNTITSISTSMQLSSTTLTSEILEQLIIDEFEQCKVKDKHAEGKDKALTADSSKRTGRTHDKHKVECFNCHKKGHYKSKCWVKGGGDEGNRPKWGKATKEEAALAEDKEEPEAWAAVEDMHEPTWMPWLNIAATTVGSPPARIGPPSGTTTELYDSGASWHMSPFRNRSLSYYKITLQAIIAADKQTFYAVGTGDACGVRQHVG